MNWPAIYLWLLAPAPAWLVLAAALWIVLMVLILRRQTTELRRILVGFLRSKARGEIQKRSQDDGD